MPTYEYVCSKCDHHFEKFQSITDEPLAICPKELCGQRKWGKGKVRRVIGAGAGLIFKGSGFYTTDYRSDSYKEAAKKDSSTTTPASATATPPAGGAAPASGGDAKPAASGGEPAKSSAGSGKKPGKGDQSGKH